MTALLGQDGNDHIAEEQAALRRVATLVARGAPPGQVLKEVTGEAGRLLSADCATMNRYGPDGTVMVVATWSSVGGTIPVGARQMLGGPNIQTTVFQTRRPARIDDWVCASGPIAEAAREFGLRAAVGVPVSVEGRLWGVMMAGSRAEPLPACTETRLAGFTELAATAIANAEAQAALAASRARIVATADATAAASNATCTTARSSAWSPSPWTCAPPRQPQRPAPVT